MYEKTKHPDLDIVICFAVYLTNQFIYEMGYTVNNPRFDFKSNAYHMNPARLHISTTTKKKLYNFE